MTERTGAAILLVVLVLLLTGCDRSGSAQTPVAPTTEAPVVTPLPARLVTFTEPGGFVTSEVRDAQNEIVHFTTAGELVWAADGTRFHGYSAQGGLSYYIPAPALCRCALEVRFGTHDGERRAYLTAEYGHHNPGTLVDLERVGESLIMTPTVIYPPGTPTLSGVVTEMTPQGPRPIEGAYVERQVSDGWRTERTDANGAYAIRGLSDGTALVSVGMGGFRTEERAVSISGDTRFDIQLVRR